MKENLPSITLTELILTILMPIYGLCSDSESSESSRVSSARSSPVTKTTENEKGA